MDGRMDRWTDGQKKGVGDSGSYGPGVNGLPYTPMRPCSNDEWRKLPHVVWSSDSAWDPSVIDHIITDNNQWMQGINVPRLDDPFNDRGEYVN